MIRGVSAWSVRRPRPVIVVALILVALGAISLRALPITRLPDADAPTVSVSVVQAGASPAELDGTVTRPIEDAIAGVEGVRHILSSITDGSSVTTVRFGFERDTDRALNDIKDAVARIRAGLPQTLSDPLITRVDVEPLPVVAYAAVAPGRTPEQLSWFVDDEVRRALQGLKGVAAVARIGGVDREIAVVLDPDRLQAVGLTAADVSRRLRSTRVDVAGGRAEIGGRDQPIRALAAATTLGGLAGTMLALPTGGQVRLDDLGTVSDTIREPRGFARLDGKPVIGFSVSRSSGASDVAVAAAVAARLDEIRAANPDVDLQSIDDTADFTRATFDSAMRTLLAGAGLAIAMVFLILRDWRTTLVVAVTLPLSIVPTFCVMECLGVSLNLISLLALTLSSGILLDDSIIAIEAVGRHLGRGKTPYAASIDAAEALGPAALAISLTAIVMVLPVSVVGTLAGPVFRPFCILIAVQLVFALLAARFVTPMLAAYLLRPKGPETPPPGPYAFALGWTMRHRFTAVATLLGLGVAALWSIQMLPAGFWPAQDTGRSRLAIELPAGSPLSATLTAAEEIAHRLRQRPEIRSVLILGGRSAPASAALHKASLIITYAPRGDRTSSQHDLERAISRNLEDLPDIRFWFADETGQRDVALIVTGPDSDTVGNVAAELVSQMHRIPVIDNVVSAATLDRPELRVHPRADLAARLGVSTESLAETIRIATIGDAGPAPATLSDGDRQVPIHVRLDAALRSDLRMLELLRVPLPGGRGSVPLGTLADLAPEQGPGDIMRSDRERQASVGADLVGDTTIGQALAEIDKLPIMKSLPPHVSIKRADDAARMDAMFDDITGLMGPALAIVFAVLVLLFGSLLQPITILFCLPPAVGGAALALFVTGRPLSLPVVLGLVMLGGIVAKHVVLLVDVALRATREGVERDAAILDAVRMRARPMVITTLALLAGLLPNALAMGAGREFRVPMAITMIGGLIVSTPLCLIVVPALFLMLHDAGRACRWMTRPFTRSRSTTREGVPAERRAAE